MPLIPAMNVTRNRTPQGQALIVSAGPRSSQIVTVCCRRVQAHCAEEPSRGSVAPRWQVTIPRHLLCKRYAPPYCIENHTNYLAQSSPLAVPRGVMGRTECFFCTVKIRSTRLWGLYSGGLVWPCFAVQRKSVLPPPLHFLPKPGHRAALQFDEQSPDPSHCPDCPNVRPIV